MASPFLNRKVLLCVCVCVYIYIYIYILCLLAGVHVVLLGLILDQYSWGERYRLPYPHCYQLNSTTAVL